MSTEYNFDFDTFNFIKSTVTFRNITINKVKDDGSTWGQMLKNYYSKGNWLRFYDCEIMVRGSLFGSNIGIQVEVVNTTIDYTYGY